MSDPRIMLPEVPADGERQAWHTLFAKIDDAIEMIGNTVPPTAGVRYADGENPDDYDPDQVPLVLVCPWCKRDAVVESLYVLEFAQGKTYADPDSSQQMVLSFDFDSDRFDETETEVAYVHESCGLPLALPDGWGAEYI